MNRLRTNGIALLLIACTRLGFSANVYVPSLELITRATLTDWVLSLTTRGDIDIVIGGGYKFGGQVGLSYQGTELEKGTSAGAAGQEGLVFRSAGVSISRILELPLSFTYFVGESDAFCSGDAFLTLFGTESAGTNYRGFMYFPTGPVYEGMHIVTGTGIKVDLQPEDSGFLLSVYGYQDSTISATDGVVGHYSLDVRTLVAMDNLKVEAYAGFTNPVSTLGYYRGGLLFFAADRGVEFVSQIGIPKWDPGVDDFGIELFYLLFEPRLHLGIFSIIPTFFWQPQYYLNVDSGMSGSFDVNLNFRLGNIQDTPVSAGLEANLSFHRQGAEQISVKGSPYFSFVTPGIIWDVKLNVKAWPFSLTDLLEGYIRIKAAF